MTVNGASSSLLAGAPRCAGGFARLGYYYRYFATWAETV